MPPKEVLIMAVTRMKAGVCTAGFINEPHLDSHLRWVRPVKSFRHLLLEDLRDNKGRIVEMGDVVALNLLKPTLENSREEDWLADFIQTPVYVIRQLTEQKRADFLANHCDKNPAAILHQQTRSLCLLQPNKLWVKFVGNFYTGSYEARLGFQLNSNSCAEVNEQHNLPVTDLKWRALGRHWLAQAGQQELYLEHDALCQRLSADIVYLSIGLSMPFQGKPWPLIIGVHPVPDYTITIDYTQL
jgi:hypothetical protein